MGAGIMRPYWVDQSLLRTSGGADRIHRPPLPADDNFDDNRDDTCAFNAAYSLKVLVNHLVRSAARSWQCRGRGSSPLSSTS